MKPLLVGFLLTLIAATFSNAAYIVYPPRYELTSAQYSALGTCLSPAHQEDAVESQYDPICATDGFSYYNKHEMRCLSKSVPSLMFSFYGRCPNEPVFLPLESARGTQLLGEPRAFEGYHQCLERCHEFQPVCGSDGKTYSSPCAIECVKKYDPQISMVSKGFCEQDKSVVGKCPEILQPFCGSDGITYLNYCHLKFAMMSEEKLQPAHMGDCVRRLVAVQGTLPKPQKSGGCGGGCGGGGCGGGGCGGGCGK